MVDVKKLKGKIVEKGLNVEKVANSIGIDHSTFYRKLNGQGETFTIKEANLICSTLELDRNEAMSIFFKGTVA